MLPRPGQQPMAVLKLQSLDIPSHTDRVCLGHCASGAYGLSPQLSFFLSTAFFLSWSISF